MAEKDPTLGLEVHRHLFGLGIETPMMQANVPLSQAYMPLAIRTLQDRFQSILSHLNLDLSDDSLRGTPKRVAEMYVNELFQGLDYSNFPSCSTFANLAKYDEVIATQASVFSCCEHHLQPFIGTAYIGYIPNGELLGLSKFNRLTDFFSRRPQVQERLTEQLHATLCYVLKTEDIAVVIKATHYCVVLRGVKDQASDTTTSKMTGKFRSEAPLRQEFLSLTTSRK